MRTLRYITVILLAVVTSSCSDYFEIDRPPQVPWGTVDEFERAAIGAYVGLFSGHDWNMAFVNERIVKSSMGDDVGFVVNPEWGYNRNSKEYNVYTEKNFVLLYRAIATVNNALDFVEEKGGNPFPEAPEEEVQNNVNRVIGELHFIRGYAYYMLATTFGHAIEPGGANDRLDVPMPLRYAQSAQEARTPPIATTQQLYNQIVRDLKRAKELLPERFEATKHHPSYQVRANRFAASAMLVRAYMQKASYDSALQECNYIINENDGDYDLSEDPIEAFNKSSISRGREVIFYAPFYDETLPPPNHLSVLNNRWNGSATPWVETYMGFKTVQRFGWMTSPTTDTTINIRARQDKRFTQLMAVRYPENRHKENQPFETRASIREFTTIWTNKYYRGSKGDRTNVPLIRLAEVYLSRAYLRLRAGDANGAASDLNIIRKRAYNETVAGVPYTPLTAGEITLSLINNERLIELFNEGDRIDYLRAIKTDIPLGERGDGTEPYTSERFVWAIPAIELNFNDKL